MACSSNQLRKLTHVIVSVYLYYLQPAIWQALVHNGLQANDQP